MATTNIYVQTGYDDGYVWNQTGSYYGYGLGQDYDPRTTIKWGNPTKFRTYFRFPISIPATAIVNTATLYLYCDNANAGTGLYARIASDNVGAFSSLSASETWNLSVGSSSTKTITSTNQWNTIDVTDLVDEFIELPGYSEGNYIGFRLTGQSTTPDTLSDIWAYEMGSNKAYIYLDYTEVAYRVRGTVSKNADIRIYFASDWSFVKTESVSAGSYSIQLDSSADVHIIAKSSDNDQILGYGTVTPEQYTP